MIKWYLKVNKLVKEIRKKSFDCIEAFLSENTDKVDAINKYLKTDYLSLSELWVKHVDKNKLGNLGQHIHFGEMHDYKDIIKLDIPQIENILEQFVFTNIDIDIQYGFEPYLHPIIVESSFEQYKSGQFRDSVLNSFIAVFDLIRDKTDVDIDGSRLVDKVFSLENPLLILSELDSQSGKNDQKGFLEIYKGAYIGIRNPKAHSLDHDLDENKAAQYLVLASLLARRVEEAQKV